MPVSPKLAARVTSKYQITIPREVREDIQLRRGDLLTFVRHGDRWELLKIPDDTVAALQLAGKSLRNIQAEDPHLEFEQGWRDEYRDG